MDQEGASGGAVLVAPGAAANSVSVVRGIRRLLITTVLAAVVSSLLITASKGQCYSETGTCVDLSMSVSPVLFIGFAVVVLFVLDRIINRDLDPFEAMRVLDRARTTVKIIAAAAIVIAHVWFWAIPMGDFGRHGVNVISPFLFGVIEVTTSVSG